MNFSGRPGLRIRRLNLDTGRENVVVVSRRSEALRPDVFRGFSRVELQAGARELLATLLITDDGIVGTDEIGLAEPAMHRFGHPPGTVVTVTPATPPLYRVHAYNASQFDLASKADPGYVVGIRGAQDERRP